MPDDAEDDEIGATEVAWTLCPLSIGEFEVTSTDLLVARGGLSWYSGLAGDMLARYRELEARGGRPLSGNRQT